MKTSTGQGINAGAMREQVTLQTRSTQQDSSGEPLPQWNQFATLRAEIVRFPSGKSTFDQASAQRIARVPTTFKLRWLDGVLPEMRLLNRSKVYRIMSAIDPTGRHEELLIMCEELVGATP